VASSTANAIQDAAGPKQRKTRRTTMKTRIFPVTAAALLLSTIFVGQCYAQNPMKANVPFAFSVGSEALPAGQYQILRAFPGNASAQVIRRTDRSAGVVVLTLSADRKSEESKCELIFHRYGDEYFLSQIWTGQRLGQEIRESDREKELAGRGTGSEVALLLHPQATGR
jgi:hypothetical protein